VSPNRVSLPRFHVRIGLHIVLFEVCSAFTRVAACTLAQSPYVVTAIRRLQTLRLLHVCSGRFRLERSPGGACTHWKSAALSRRTWNPVIHREATEAIKLSLATTGPIAPTTLLMLTIVPLVSCGAPGQKPICSAVFATLSFTLSTSLHSFFPSPQINGPACQRSRQFSFLLTEDIQKSLFLYMCTFGKYLTIRGNLEHHVR
jgi:hypothetical protein